MVKKWFTEFRCSRTSTEDAKLSGRPIEISTSETIGVVQSQYERVCESFVDETWIHHNTPETKQQSKQWVSRGESGPKKAKVGLSANKVMATVFWESRGIIHIDYLQKGKQVNGEYYSNLLGRFDEALKKKRPHLAKKIVLFYQDNARVHTCAVSMAKLHELGYELLPHPAYSPDLAPSDYFLFPNLKN